MGNGGLWRSSGTARENVETHIPIRNTHLPLSIQSHATESVSLTSYIVYNDASVVAYNSHMFGNNEDCV